MQKNLQNKIPSSSVFKRFKQIALNSHHDYYTFYKAYSAEICLLDFEEYVEIKFNFILALFHLDKYAEFYFYADDMMSELLNSPTFDIRSRDVYEQILWHKAEAFRNQRKTENAQYLYCELLKMNPVNKKYKRKLFYSLIQNERLKNRKTMSLVILFISLSLCCSLLSLFSVKPYFYDSTAIVLFGRYLFFVFGLSLFLLLQSIQIKQALNYIRKIKTD